MNRGSIPLLASNKIDDLRNVRVLIVVKCRTQFTEVALAHTDPLHPHRGQSSLKANSKEIRIEAGDEVFHKLKSNE